MKETDKFIKVTCYSTNIPLFIRKNTIRGYYTTANTRVELRTEFDSTKELHKLYYPGTLQQFEDELNLP